MPVSPVSQDRAISFAGATDWLLQRAHLLLVVGLLLIGLATVRDYGQTWDEPLLARYGHYALGAYRYFFHPRQLPSFDPLVDSYGPAYFMAATVAASAAGAINTAWDSATVWHFCNFLTFLFAILLMYSFSRRWLTPMASLGACVLLASQPLLWGHAFINPKDIPFMALFLASVHAGFDMVDRSSQGRRSFLATTVAAIVLGITVSIRSAGPLAGLIVATYAFARLGRRSLALLAAYLPMAFLAAYLTWPFLWAAPLSRLWHSLTEMSNFPFHPRVQFMGAYYPPNELPWFYVPVSFGIQLTEPVVPLLIGGLGVAIRRMVGRPSVESQNARAVIYLFLGWSLLPVIMIVGMGSTLYDNARQLYFLLPPVFLTAGLALEAFEKLVRPGILLLGIFMLLALPGVRAVRHLHPYEYVYYNSYVGGTGGAYGYYEMDYWATSYREIAAWLNGHAPADSGIWIMGGPTDLISQDLRPDLRVTCTSDTSCTAMYDYVVALARWKAETRCRRANVAFSVGREGAVFSVVKQLPAGKVCN